MPTTIVRYVGGLVALLGIGMLIWRTGDNSGISYDIVRWIHIVLAVGFLGLYEASLARAKRTGRLTPDGRPISMVGRISATLALLLGLLLLISMVANLFNYDVTNVTVYIHALVGLIAVGVAIVLFSRQYVKN